MHVDSFQMEETEVWLHVCVSMYISCQMEEGAGGSQAHRTN